ncbi:helix-turn-helix transcriptional regulator [Streptomyces sp. NPDC001634]|uniref:helix-turn-helix domain-containing protein n=1 Tax=Streptomyces sp. NPDC001634 TaxID=3154390 RepID=UPI003327E0F8
MKRQVSYQWRLREVMATRGIFVASDLSPLLADRGIELSSVQVWRLVTQTPERLSLPVLAALCDILDVTPAELGRTHHGPRRSRHPRGRLGGRAVQRGRGIRVTRAPTGLRCGGFMSW